MVRNFIDLWRARLVGLTGDRSVDHFLEQKMFFNVFLNKTDDNAIIQRGLTD